MRAVCRALLWLLLIHGTDAISVRRQTSAQGIQLGGGGDDQTIEGFLAGNQGLANIKELKCAEEDVVLNTNDMREYVLLVEAVENHASKLDPAFKMAQTITGVLKDGKACSSSLRLPIATCPCLCPCPCSPRSCCSVHRTARKGRV